MRHLLILAALSACSLSVGAQITLQPFPHLPALDQSFFSGEEETSDVYRGDFYLRDRRYTASLRFIPKYAETITVATIKAVPDDDVHHLSTMITGTVSSLMHAINVRNTSFIISSGDVIDGDVFYRKGITIAGETTLEHPYFSSIVALTGCNSSTSLSCLLYIPLENPLQIELTVGIPVQRHIHPFVTMQQLECTFIGAPPTLGLMARVRMALPSGDILNAATYGSVSAQSELTLQGSVEGAWHHACGIEQLTLENVGVGLSALINPVAPPHVVPTGCDIAGSMKLGTKTVQVVSHIAVPSHVGFIGSLNSISLRDIMQYAAYLSHQTCDETKIPELELRDFFISFAPQSFSIAGLDFESGIVARGVLHLFNADLSLAMHVSDQGLFGFSPIKPIMLGALLVTNQHDAPPSLHVALRESIPHISLKGSLVAGSLLNTEGEVAIAADGITFSCTHEVPIGRESIHFFMDAVAPFTTDNPSFTVRIQFLESFKTYLMSWLDRYAVYEKNKWLKHIQIRTVEFEGTLDEVVDGIVPRLALTMLIGEREVTMKNLPFNIKEPRSSVLLIVGRIIEALSHVPENLFFGQ